MGIIATRMVFYFFGLNFVIFGHAAEVPAEAFWSCPSNKAKQQFKAFEIESNQRCKGIEEEEIKHSKQSNEMNTL